LTDRPVTMLDPEIDGCLSPPEPSPYAITPDTYPHGRILRELGGEWDEAAQVWRFERNDMPSSLTDLIARHPVPNRSRTPRYWSRYRQLEDRLLRDAAALPDHELLELLLSFSVPRLESDALAQALLARFRSLGGTMAASRQGLFEFDKVNLHTVVLFKTLRELARRLARERLVEREIINAETVMPYLRTMMADEPDEQLRLLFLDAKNQLLCDEVVIQGSVNAISVHPRDVAKRALALDATAVLLVHNHPSGDPRPSKQDIDMTRAIKKALATIGVALRDHIVITRHDSFSFREEKKL